MLDVLGNIARFLEILAQNKLFAVKNVDGQKLYGGVGTAMKDWITSFTRLDNGMYEVSFQSGKVCSNVNIAESFSYTEFVPAE